MQCPELYCHLDVQGHGDVPVILRVYILLRDAQNCILPFRSPCHADVQKVYILLNAQNFVLFKCMSRTMFQV